MNDKAAQLLQELAEKLGTTVQYLWAVLVRGNQIQGIYCLFVAALFAGLGYISYRLIKHSYAENVYNDEEYMVGGIVAGVVSLAVFLITFYYGLILTLSPQYGAIQDILEAVKK